MPRWTPRPRSLRANCGCPPPSGGNGNLAACIAAALEGQTPEPTPHAHGDFELKHLCDEQADGTFVPFCMKHTVVFDEAGAVVSETTQAINYDGSPYTITGTPGPCPNKVDCPADINPGVQGSVSDIFNT